MKKEVVRTSVEEFLGAEKVVLVSGSGVRVNTEGCWSLGVEVMESIGMQR